MAELTVGVRELKSHLSRYLRQVETGRTIVITKRGKAVGRLIPAGLSLEGKLEALRRAGLIRWNGKKLPPYQPVARVRGPKTVADMLIEDRR